MVKLKISFLDFLIEDLSFVKCLVEIEIKLIVLEIIEVCFIDVDDVFFDVVKFLLLLKYLGMNF